MSFVIPAVIALPASIPPFKNQLTQRAGADGHGCTDHGVISDAGTDTGAPTRRWGPSGPICAALRGPPRRPRPMAFQRNHWLIDDMVRLLGRSMGSPSARDHTP